jgi:hypothetical protein
LIVDPNLAVLGPALIDNVYHVGHLVPDLLAAMEVFGRDLHIDWAPPFEMPSGFNFPDGTSDSQTVRIAFSKQGPLFLELIEVTPVPGSIFSEPAAGGMHHYGYYAADWRGEVERLVADGWELERRGQGVAYVRDPRTGVRLEVVSFKGRDFMLQILSGEMARNFPLSARA